VRPKLQVALDVLELDRAVQIGLEAIEGGADWLEAGTPLIKSEGMDTVRTLRDEFRGNKIIADMKTMDTGAIEVEMAAKAGADIVAILGVSDDSTIKDSVRTAREYGVELMVDIINVPNPIERSEEIAGMDVDYLCVHVGIDQQMMGMDALDILREVKDVPCRIAIGGGLDAASAGNAVSMGAEIVVVGGNIIRSADVRESTRRIRESIDRAEMREDKKKSREEEIIDLLMRVSTPNISDAMHRIQSMHGIRPIYPGIKVAGKAVTVQTFEGDWAKTVEAIDAAEKGDIIVVYSPKVATWGELASHSAKNKGIAALVVDGPVRDIDDILKMRFPIFCTDVVANAGDPKGFGEINAEITCGDVKVRPGDYIVGDDNGVIVVPKERAYEIARRALEVKKNEERVREEIKRGSTLSQVVDLSKWEKR
jgi:3-hexulose-6-phosphate synthase/6-phospho-3-hexuloisomerase